MGLPVGGAGAACRPPASPGRRRSPPHAVARPAGETGARAPFAAGRHVKAVGGSDSGVRRGTSDACAVHRRIGPAQDRRCRSRTANGGRRLARRSTEMPSPSTAGRIGAGASARAARRTTPPGRFRCPRPRLASPRHRRGSRGGQSARRAASACGGPRHGRPRRSSSGR